VSSRDSKEAEHMFDRMMASRTDPAVADIAGISIVLKSEHFERSLADAGPVVSSAYAWLVAMIDLFLKEQQGRSADRSGR
jgi:hypothetical protein